MLVLNKLLHKYLKIPFQFLMWQILIDMIQIKKSFSEVFEKI